MERDIGMDKLLRPEEAFPNGKPSAKTLANWRVLGKGPKFVRVGGLIYYHADDIAAWVKANTFSSTSEKVAA